LRAPISIWGDWRKETGAMMENNTGSNVFAMNYVNENSNRLLASDSASRGQQQHHHSATQELKTTKLFPMQQRQPFQILNTNTIDTGTNGADITGIRSSQRKNTLKVRIYPGVLFVLIRK
jgi:hypothetical protein